MLCAYLRMPYPPHPDEDAPVTEHLTWQANREIRHTVIRTIRDHLLPTTPPDTSWSGYDLDFTGTVFDGGDFSDARFSGRVTFNNAEFADGIVSFQGACGGTVNFANSLFGSGAVSFTQAKFLGGTVDFTGVVFSSATVDFRRAGFTGGVVDLRNSHWLTPPVFDDDVLADHRPGLLLPDRPPESAS
ncbi:pentapeptide repeat-containing protein [Streptomyces mirabilis]|uniref:pentapeptide repeat-containing protein n=1 Tax=Streptomyces mirabilis TaxID=68239 RepID=UPI0036E6B294